MGGWSPVTANRISRIVPLPIGRVFAIWHQENTASDQSA